MIARTSRGPPAAATMVPRGSASSSCGTVTDSAGTGTVSNCAPTCCNSPRAPSNAIIGRPASCNRLTAERSSGTRVTSRDGSPLSARSRTGPSVTSKGGRPTVAAASTLSRWVAPISAADHGRVPGSPVVAVTTKKTAIAIALILAALAVDRQIQSSPTPTSSQDRMMATRGPSEDVDGIQTDTATSAATQAQTRLRPARCRRSKTIPTAPSRTAGSRSSPTARETKVDNRSPTPSPRSAPNGTTHDHATTGSSPGRLMASVAARQVVQAAATRWRTPTTTAPSVTAASRGHP